MANSVGSAFATSLPMAPRPFPAILVGGLVVGVIDLLYAIVVYSPHKPILVPQTIASGVLGAKSYSGGAPTAVLGVLLHFVIALGAATVYYLASRKLGILITRAVLFGLLYGALVYLFMYPCPRPPKETCPGFTRRPSLSSTGSALGCRLHSRYGTIRTDAR